FTYYLVIPCKDCLTAGIQPLAARADEGILQEHADIHEGAGRKTPIKADKEPDRRAEEAEIFFHLAIPPRLVGALDAKQAVKRVPDAPPPLQIGLEPLRRVIVILRLMRLLGLGCNRLQDPVGDPLLRRIAHNIDFPRLDVMPARRIACARQDPDQRILWHLGWQEAANGAPARNGGMNRRHVFYGHFDPLFKRKRKPGRDQWPENNDGENEELDPEERDNGTVYHPQPDPFRDNALHNKKQQPKWRRQQADLQRDQHDNEERQEIYIAGRGKRQKEGKRQQHHADLIHERAEEQQHCNNQQKRADGAELPRSDDAQKPSRRAGNLQDLAEGCRARNDKEDHRRHLRRLAKRLHQRLEIELAIAKTGDYCGNTAKRRRFLGGCNLEDNAADDNTEDQQQRHHIREKSAPRASPVDLRLIIGTERGKRWIEPAADNDIECEERRHQKAGHDTGEQQILDRAFGKACEQDGERRRRYQHGDSAHGHDRAHGERR